jgi:hypothetical protein
MQWLRALRQGSACVLSLLACAICSAADEPGTHSMPIKGLSQTPLSREHVSVPFVFGPRGVQPLAAAVNGIDYHGGAGHAEHCERVPGLVWQLDG